MPAVAASISTACVGCGAPLETSSSAELGCMVCLLDLGLNYTSRRSEEGALDGSFGQYVIAQRDDGRPWELGRGGMGATYRATDILLERPVALKIIRLDRARNAASARERFLREARAAAALRHPHIAAVYQFGIREESGQCFYATIARPLSL